MSPSDVKTYNKNIIINTALYCHTTTLIDQQESRKSKNGPNIYRHLKSVGKILSHEICRIGTLVSHQDKNTIVSILNILCRNKFQMFLLDKRFKYNN